MKFYNDKRHSLDKYITGPMISLIFHVVLIFCMIVWMVPKIVEEKESVVVNMDIEDVVEVDDRDIEELFDEEDDVIDNTVENEYVEEIPEVEENFDVDGEFDIVSDDVIEGFEIDNVEIVGSTPDKGIKDIMVKKYGSRAKKNGLLGTYFNRYDFFGKAYSRIDKTLNKPLNTESPWPEKIPPVCYSVLWTGRIVPKVGGVYTIYLSSDDGARLWIDGEVVVEQWYVHATRVDKIQIEMIEGESYDIKYAFNQQYGPSCSKLEWSCEDAGIDRQLIPTGCMWADGVYSLQVLSWIKQRNKSLTKHCMNNPAIRDEIPMSHIVRTRDNKITESYLRNVKLDEVIPVLNKFKDKGLLDKKPIQTVSKKVLRSDKTSKNLFGEEEDIF